MTAPPGLLTPAPGARAAAAPARLARLMVGHDGSPAAEAAARFALELAPRAGADVTLFHAAPGRDSPAETLIAAAREAQADLLLVGSRGLGRLRGALLGSVSAQLLTHAPCPVMVCREDLPRADGMPRSVLVGVDGSAGARHALEVGQSLAAALQARLVLLHAYDASGPFVSRPSRPLLEVVRRRGRAILDEARGVLDMPCGTELVEWDAYSALTAACAAHAPAVLVVGSRGRGGFEELLLGSTARRLAGRAPCPVVVVRPPVPTG